MGYYERQKGYLLLESDSKQLFVSTDVVFNVIEFPFAANLDTEQQWFLDIADKAYGQDVQEVQIPVTIVHIPDTAGDLEPEESISEGDESE